jgi:hypothetical protein
VRSKREVSILPGFKELSPQKNTGQAVKTTTGSSNQGREPPFNPAKVGLPDASPPVPVEMMDVQVQVGESGGPFNGRETWDVTFKASGQVSIGKMVMNARGQMEEPIQYTFSAERSFNTMADWPRYIRSFKFQNDEIPPLLGDELRRAFNPTI